MMGLDLGFLITASGMVFMAALAQSLTGFGIALVLVPLLSLIWDPRAVVVVSAILNAVLSISLTIRVRRTVSLWSVGLLLIGALAGIPLGLAILTGLDPNPLRVLIGSLVIVLGGLIYFGMVPPPGPERISLLAAGVLSGILHSSTSMGGPPAVLCLMSQQRPKEEMRGTLLGFFGPLSVLAVAGFWTGGLVRTHVLVVTVALLPALALGIWLGDMAFERAPARVFQLTVILLIAVAGALSVATGLRGGP